MGVSQGRRIAMVLLCAVLPALWSYSIRSNFQGAMKMADFSGIYYGSRCVIHHRDPYKYGEYFDELREDNPNYLRAELGVLKRNGMAPAFVYLPTALLAMVPLALLPWTMAQNLFLILTAGSVALAALLVWDLGSDLMPWVFGFLICFDVANSLLLLLLGNPAGIAVSFCIIAAWCFLKERYVWAGVALLALSLAIKPHDSGFLWLFFLLAGGVLRKRALQTLAVVGVLGICSVVWIAGSSPNWPHEVSENVHAVECCGGLDDPGPLGLPAKSQLGPLISMQSVVSIFNDNPRFYNPVSYTVTGLLILVWAVTVLRQPFTWKGALLALAAISALSMLPVYHRQEDARLLELQIPACAMLWSDGRARRWISLGLTAAAILINSDVVNIPVLGTMAGYHVSANSLTGKMTLLLLRPSTLLLLAGGCFYLWIFMRYKPSPPETEDERSHGARAAEAAAT